MSMPDRDHKYMKEMWGTTRLITDYTPNYNNEPKVIQEVMYDPANKIKPTQDLYENIDENEFEYGVEPTYKLNGGQKVL